MLMKLHKKPVKDPQVRSFTSSLCENYLQGRFTDMQIICGGHVFKCHQIILSSASTYFRELIANAPRGTNVTSDLTFVFVDIGAELLKAILDLIYGLDVYLDDSCDLAALFGLLRQKFGLLIESSNFTVKPAAQDPTVANGHLEETTNHNFVSGDIAGKTGRGNLKRKEEEEEEEESVNDVVVTNGNLMNKNKKPKPLKKNKTSEQEAEKEKEKEGQQMASAQSITQNVIMDNSFLFGANKSLLALQSINGHNNNVQEREEEQIQEQNNQVAIYEGHLDFVPKAKVSKSRKPKVSKENVQQFLNFLHTGQSIKPSSRTSASRTVSLSGSRTNSASGSGHKASPPPPPLMKAGLKAQVSNQVLKVTCTFSNCRKNFVQENSMLVHVATKHHGLILPCPGHECQRSFTNGNGFLAHINSHFEFRDQSKVKNWLLCEIQHAQRSKDQSYNFQDEDEDNDLDEDGDNDQDENEDEEPDLTLGYSSQESENIFFSQSMV